MKRRRKVTREITIETTETILSQDGSSITALHCHQCGEGSRLVAFAEIVSALGMDPLTLHRWLNEGRVHFQPSEKGGLAICWNTLSALLDEQPEFPNSLPLRSPKEVLPPARQIGRGAPDQVKHPGPRRSS